MVTTLVCGDQDQSLRISYTQCLQQSLAVYWQSHSETLCHTESLLQMIWLVCGHFTALLEINTEHLLLAVTQCSPISHPQISGKSKLMLHQSFLLLWFSVH